MSNHNEKILVRGTNWLGDSLMTTPALASLKRKFPGSSIHLVVRSYLEDLFIYNPNVDKIITYDPGHGPARILRFRKLVNMLKREKYTKAILFQNAFEAGLIAYFSRIPYRLGYDCQSRGYFLTHPVKVEHNSNKHQVYYYLDLVKKLGATWDQPRLEVFFGEEHASETTNIINEFLNDNQLPIIGIAPGAAYGPSKRWNPDFFAELCAKLVHESGCYIVLFGSQNEKHLGDTILNRVKLNIVNLAGKLSLLTSAAMMKRCGLLVSNDSGAMHLGVAAGARVIAIFGPTNPIATGPLGQQQVVIQKHVPCAPCLYRECPENHQCMEAITVDEVFNNVLNILERKENPVDNCSQNTVK